MQTREKLTNWREREGTDLDECSVNIREAIAIIWSVGREIDDLPFFGELLDMREYSRYLDIANLRNIID